MAWLLSMGGYTGDAALFALSSRHPDGSVAKLLPGSIHHCSLVLMFLMTWLLVLVYLSVCLTGCLSV